MSHSSRKAFVLLSHILTIEQERELREKWKVKDVLRLPQELQRVWSSVPPDLEGIFDYLSPLLLWLERETKEGDVAVIQGDFGATYLAVKKALELGLIPLYATTKRELKETLLPDGSVRQERVFKHERFRVYGR